MALPPVPGTQIRANYFLACWVLLLQFIGQGGGSWSFLPLGGVSCFPKNLQMGREKEMALKYTGHSSAKCSFIQQLEIVLFLRMLNGYNNRA